MQRRYVVILATYVLRDKISAVVLYALYLKISYRQEVAYS
jgi:hypothetical protein